MKASQLKTDRKPSRVENRGNTPTEQLANELVVCLRDSFRGQRATLEQFSARHLTAKGDAIAATASPRMGESELHSVAMAAVTAAY